MLRSLRIEEILHLLQLVGPAGSQVVVLGGIAALQIADVVELPLVPRDDVGRRLRAQYPRKRHRCGRRDPAVVVDGAITEHLEVLRHVPGRGVRVRLGPRVRHAHSVQRPLLDAVDHVRQRDAGCFKDGRRDVDKMGKLTADAADVGNVSGPRHRHSLGRPAVVRRDLLHPLERRVHRP